MKYTNEFESNDTIENSLNREKTKDEESNNFFTPKKLDIYFIKNGKEKRYIINLSDILLFALLENHI